MSAIDLHFSRQPRAAKGTVERNGRLMCACRFDEAMFDEINRLATAANISFAEQVRRLCQKGLLDRRAA